MKVTLNAVTQPILQASDHDDIVDMGRQLTPEEYMIYCARVSSPGNRLNHATAPKLLKYLIDAGHWSPFEMISIGIEVETSRAIAQQILRHRSFSFQEFSQRYAKVERMEPVELRFQATKNRQSSTDIVPPGAVDYKLVEDCVNHCRATYEKLIDMGIAKESARMVLPLTTGTTIVMHGTLRSWIHFFNQRCSEHAQKEIQELAYAARELVSDVCPWTASALEWNEPF